MIAEGVGRSGSPTPRLITSRPAASAAFFFLSISANRYGGSFWRRSAFTNGIGIGCPKGSEEISPRGNRSPCGGRSLQHSQEEARILEQSSPPLRATRDEVPAVSRSGYRHVG